jgi:hypothetical protein
MPMTFKSSRGRALAGALICALMLPVGANAQTPPLAEVAKKEAERRKGIKETQKVITTKDLPESARKPKTAPAPATESAVPATAPGQPSAAGGGGAETQKSGAGDTSTAKDESSWRTRITQAREAVRRSEMFAEALQSRINALTTDFVNRDNPMQRAQIGEERQKALEELARVKSDIEQNRKLVDDIEEEARKAGVPPGWLR